MERATPLLAARIPAQRIESRIYLIRGQKVMLSNDLAELYGVPAKRLNQAVARNAARFPHDFMFRLTMKEAGNSRSQIVTLKRGMNLKYLPYAFTEQGVAMLSAVLHSPTAVAVSIEIMRVFVRLRRLLASHEGLRRKLADLERKLLDHDGKFAVVFDAIRRLVDEPDPPPKPPIGYHTEARG
jgi:hypothetical protein